VAERELDKNRICPTVPIRRAQGVPLLDDKYNHVCTSTIWVPGAMRCESGVWMASYPTCSGRFSTRRTFTSVGRLCLRFAGTYAHSTGRWKRPPLRLRSRSMVTDQQHCMRITHYFAMYGHRISLIIGGPTNRGHRISRRGGTRKIGETGLLVISFRFRVHVSLFLFVVVVFFLFRLIGVSGQNVKASP